MSTVVNAGSGDAPLTTTPRKRGRLRTAHDAHIWESMLRSWQRSLRSNNRAEGTIHVYGQSYRRLMEWALDDDLGGGITDPEDITRKHLEAFFAYELVDRPKPMKASTVANDFRQLRVFFGWLAAEQDEDDPRSVMRNMTAPTVPTKKVDVFTDEELRALLATCRGKTFVERRDTALLRLLLDTGVRRAELAGLTLDDVDLDAQVIEVLGKGSKYRDVAFGAKTADALDAYLRARAKHRDRNKTDALWLAVAPHRGALRIDGIRQIVERRAAEAGVEEAFPHKFRHTAAHAALSAGMSEGDAMRHFGWSSRSMLDRYGASAAQARAVATARRLSVGDRV